MQLTPIAGIGLARVSPVLRDPKSGAILPRRAYAGWYPDPRAARRLNRFAGLAALVAFVVLVAAGLDIRG